MKKYFEYEFNDDIKKNLIDFYNQPSKMHGDNHKRKMKMKLERALKSVNIEKSDKVLDVGCSEGELLKELSDKIAFGLGLDLAEGIIMDNNKNNKFNNISYKIFDGEHIDESDIYDKIFLLDVLEHAFSPDELVKSIFKRLNNKGDFIIEVPTTGWLSEMIFGKYHLGHLRYYDQEYLCKYLNGFGFKIKSVNTYNSVPLSSVFIKYPKLFKLFKGLCDIIPHRLYPYYGSIMVVAGK